MHTPPIRPAPERFASVLRWLNQAVLAQTLGGPLSQFLIGFVTTRITRAIQCVADLAARIAAGTYSPRHRAAAPRKTSAVHRPPPSPGPAPRHCGWLVALLPYGGAHRAALEDLLRDPEMAALMQAAPVPIARVLRPLCWMLAVDLPPALARRKTSPAAADQPPDPTQAVPARTCKIPRPRRPQAPPPPPAPWLAPRPALTLEYGYGPPRLVWN